MSSGIDSSSLPPPPIVEAVAASTANAVGTASASTIATPPRRHNVVAIWCQNMGRKCLPKWLRDRYERQYVFLVVMTSPVWRILVSLCILLLLFGSAIQNIWCPPQYDYIFDILFTVAFGVFCLDIIFRIVVVPGYLGFKYKALIHQLMRWSRRSKSQRYDPADEDPEKWGKIHIGSFLFWCDLVSTASILYQISFINKKQNEVVAVNIELDRFGFPLEGQVNQSFFVQRDVFLLVTIGKTVRVVRFVRSSRVAKLVGLVNWYWPFQVLNPYNIRAYFLGDGRSGSSNNNSGDPGMDGSGKSGTSNNGKNKKNDDGSRKDGGPAGNPTSYGGDNRNNNGRELMRQRSWGGLGLATLAAVKAHNLAKEEQEKQSRGPWGKVKKVLWIIGILRNDKAEWRRQLAATKIQRAWRKAKHYDIPEKEEEFAWHGGSLRKSPSSAKSFRKQSIMRHYSSMNKANLRSSKNRGAGGDGGGVPNQSTTGSPGQNANYFDRRGTESQVGGAMRELTGQRVAIGIIVSLILTVLFTFSETDASRPSTMIVLHTQTQHPFFAAASLEAARTSSVPDIYKYEFANGTIAEFSCLTGEDPATLRKRETYRVIVLDARGRHTVGWFAYRQERQQQAFTELLSTIFILLIWLFGVTAFAGPVMVLVVLPIERMVRLLGMLMLDPLGYQSTSGYRKFVGEEDVLTKNTRWTKEVLKGMETSFLMSTILRIGSLMKVGFGSAGVEIIRQNLQKKQGGNVNLLTSQGTTVSCIFLFCDIRQFTDATECLQEEVFVFTNRIAAVVHSFCHSYGGSANKNIGDAFLCSWLLDDPNDESNSMSRQSYGNKDGLCANNNQADKCLLCVVKICMALHHDQYYVETMSDAARERLLAKLSKRPGPIVQMGCGLHAGKAVQGAIGSERKIDATYVSEAVEMAEFLESSTKKYGVHMLMSDSFHRLLHSSNRYRCRIVDQIVKRDDDDDEEEVYDGDVTELYTYDINIDALWEVPAVPGEGTETISDTESFNDRLGSRRDMKSNLSLRGKSGKLGGKPRPGRRVSVTRLSGKSAPDVAAVSDEMKMDASASFGVGVATGVPQSNAQVVGDKGEAAPFVKPELVLPTGPALYNANIWRSEQMLKIRAKYSDGLFFHKFNSGLQSFYAQDWDHAKQCFQGILDDCLDDGPSKYFLSQIEKYNGKPPPNFRPYGIA